jgi:intein-encoded DNA endonuclease-like protein
MYKSNRLKNDKIKRPKLRPEHVIIIIGDQEIKDFRTLLNINYKKMMAKINFAVRFIINIS